jgi:GNAT superfamily N-acetyltransferase
MILAKHEDKMVVAEILTEAFDDNKSVNYVVKNDRRRQERIRKLMEYSFDICHSFGEVWMTHDRQACALILFTEKKRLSFTSVLWDLKLIFSVIGLTRLPAIMKREALIKKGYPSSPFAYLWFLGVKPEAQGKKIGSEVLQHLLSRYQSQGKAMYLETSMERNLPFYTRAGFEIFKMQQLSYTLYQLRTKAE